MEGTEARVAGGHNKVRAIRAVLRGGYATTLITDSVAAKGLLEGSGPAPPEAP
jgi:DNA-binding transcriptional regulator LsrR (DeoR family)